MREKSVITKFLELGDCFIKDFYKRITNDLTLRFRIRHPFEAVEEELRFIGDTDIEIKVITIEFFNLLTLVQAQQTIVNKHASQLFTDRFMDQCGSHGRINPT